jgi:hypothetical protein
MRQAQHCDEHDAMTGGIELLDAPAAPQQLNLRPVFAVVAMAAAALFVWKLSQLLAQLEKDDRNLGTAIDGIRNELWGEINDVRGSVEALTRDRDFYSSKGADHVERPEVTGTADAATRAADEGAARGPGRGEVGSPSVN